jgi:hypothetical protein
MAPQIYQRFIVLGALLYVEEETNDTESVPFLKGFRAAAISWGQFYKYFYGRNLQISLYSVCPWQAFPA